MSRHYSIADHVERLDFLDTLPIIYVEDGKFWVGGKVKKKGSLPRPRRMFSERPVG